MFHYQTYNFQMQGHTLDINKTNLWRVVKQPLGQVREHVIQVFRVAVLDDGPRGFDDRQSDPGVLMSDGLHERFDQTLSLHVKVFWRKRWGKCTSDFLLQLPLRWMIHKE